MTPEIPLCCPPLPACTPSLRPEQSRRNLELTSLTRHQSPSHSIAADNTPVDTHCTIVGQVFQRRSHGRISWWHHVPPCKLSIDAVMDSCVIVGGLWVPSPIANNADKYMHNGSRIVMGALRSMHNVTLQNHVIRELTTAGVRGSFRELQLQLVLQAFWRPEAHQEMMVNSSNSMPVIHAPPRPHVCRIPPTRCMQHACFLRRPEHAFSTPPTTICRLHVMMSTACWIPCTATLWKCSTGQNPTKRR
jgi:hypothetical protein